MLLDDEVDDEAGRPLVIQVTLDGVQGHLGPAQELAAGAWGDFTHVTLACGECG